MEDGEGEWSSDDSFLEIVHEMIHDFFNLFLNSVGWIVEAHKFKQEK